ncbi:hypothetical protein GCM10009682_23000 [Luedemannella flava]|uniref:DUF4265 domain-containing protein n=1 Tax=Luedemannella flava TaxID=349316 RepID=A0ABN2LWE1_9ACTN
MKDGCPTTRKACGAAAVGPDTAHISNAPFLQDGVAEGDIVRFMTAADGTCWATERVEASGNCTIRVLPIPDGPLGRSAHAVHERLAPLGLGGETFSDELPLVAFTVPVTADLPAVKAILVHGETEGWWAFETGCVTDAWTAA